MHASLADLTGWGGALLLLTAYFLTLVKDWNVDSGRYILLSCLASILLCVNAALNAAHPFLVINLAIIAVAAYKVIHDGWPKWR